MPSTNDAPPWQIAGHSVPGALHRRNDLPNQDAIDWWQDESGLPAILSVADGHGSPRYFRSAQGAQLAVRTAIEVLREFMASLPDPANLLAIKRSAEEGLPKSIVRRWQDAVRAHLDEEPLSAEEEAVDNPTLPYGATILSVLVTSDFILYLQLGDGDILTVSAQGEVGRPLPADSRLFANETTSLCSRESWNDFRLAFRPITGEPPALLLLATDGYPNSFRSREGFEQVGSDLLEIIRTDGLDSVRESLPAWLEEASEQGSGDDITVGLIARMAHSAVTPARDIEADPPAAQA